MRKAITITITCAALALSGCATGPTGAGYRPLVDTRGASAAHYESDLAECQQYATQRTGAAGGAVAGAVFGALLGVALMAVGGGRGGFGNEIAAGGAITGGLQGAAQGEGTQRDIIRRCLAGRGHSVLD